MICDLCSREAKAEVTEKKAYCTIHLQGKPIKNMSMINVKSEEYGF